MKIFSQTLMISLQKCLGVCIRCAYTNVKKLGVYRSVVVCCRDVLLITDSFVKAIDREWERNAGVTVRVSAPGCWCEAWCYDLWLLWYSWNGQSLIRVCFCCRVLTIILRIFSPYPLVFYFIWYIFLAWRICPLKNPAVVL